MKIDVEGMSFLFQAVVVVGFVMLMLALLKRDRLGDSVKVLQIIGISLLAMGVVSLVLLRILGPPSDGAELDMIVKGGLISFTGALFATKAFIGVKSQEQDMFIVGLGASSYFASMVLILLGWLF